MANENNPEWAREQTLRDLLAKTNRTNELLDALAKSGRPDLSKLGQASAASTTASNRVADGLGANADATRDLNKSFGRSINQLNDILGGNSGSTIGMVGGQLRNLGGETGKATGFMSKFGRVAALLGEAAKLGWDRVTDLAGAVFDAYDAGIVFKGGLHELNNSVADLGLTLDTFQKVIGKNAMVVQTLGTKRFVELGKSMQAATNYGTTLGMKSDEVVQYMSDYVDQVRITSGLEGVTNDQLIEGSKKYLTELNAVSQATGKRREQIQAEVKQMQKRPDYLALVATFPKEIRANLQNAVKEFQKFGSMAPKIQDIVSDVLTRGGVGGIQDAAARTAILQSKGATEAVMRYVDALKRGSIEEADAAREDLMKSFEQFGESMAPSQARLSGLISEAASFAASTVAETRDSLMRAQQGGKVAEDAAGIVNTQAEINRALAEVNAKVNMALIPAIEAMTIPMSAAAKSTIALTEAFDGLLQKLGLVDQFGGISMSAGIGIAATTAATLLGSKALLGKLMRVLGPKIGESISKIPGLSKLGLGAAEIAGGATAGTAGTAAAGGGMLKGITRLLGRLAAPIAGGVAAYDTYERTGSAVEGVAAGGGALAGGIAGAEAGALLGSFLGPVGTLVGGLVGGAAGGYLGQEGVEALFDWFKGGDAQGASASPETQQQITEMARTAQSQQDQQSAKLDELNSSIKELIEVVRDQTRVLEDAYSRGAGSVY